MISKQIMLFWLFDDFYLASSSAFCPSISKILPKAASMLAFSPETLMIMTFTVVMTNMVMVMVTLMSIINLDNNNKNFDDR